MPKKYMHLPFIFLILTACTGVWMRLFPFSSTVQQIDYDHLLHAHSHLAIFGWTFLAVVLLFLYFTWEAIQDKKRVKIMIGTITLVTLFLFPAFIYEGYGRLSIALSSLHIFVEYWFAFFIWKTSKNSQVIPFIAGKFFRAGAMMLIISSIGSFSLGGITSLGLQETTFFDVAIYFYLHFQYNGWLYFMLIGFIILLCSRLNIYLNRGLLTKSFYIYLIAIFPSFILSILWVDLGAFTYILAITGGIGQLIGVSLLLLTIVKVRKHIRDRVDEIFHFLFTLSLTILLIKTVVELGVIFPIFKDTIYETRHLMIGHFHLTFLGFISLLLFALFHLCRSDKVDRQLYQLGIYTFVLGFCLNELVLLMVSLFEWIGWAKFPLQNSLLLIASITMFISICFIWCPTKTKRISFPIEVNSNKEKASHL